jgi:hypothetical protein
MGTQSLRYAIDAHGSESSCPHFDLTTHIPAATVGTRRPKPVDTAVAVGAFGGVADTWRRASGGLQLGDQTAAPKHLERVAGSRAVHVAKRVAAPLADTDPMLHLFHLPW